MARFKQVALTIASAAAFVVPASVVVATGGDGETTYLDREIAWASFVVPDGNCGPARTRVGAHSHHDYFTSNTSPRTRTIWFGVVIEMWDCQGEYSLYASAVEYASGVSMAARPFNIARGVGSAKINMTLEACVTVPSPGGCFPVEVHLKVRGVGKPEVVRNKTDIHEPDCTIIERDKQTTRAAVASGTISYTIPGHEPRTLQLTKHDLGPDGAWLQKGTEFNYFEGSSGSCIEQ